MVKALTAKLLVTAVLADGKRVDLDARIRPPFEADDKRWVAEVQIKPLQEKPIAVRGVDSFHAIWLACSLVLKLLTELKTAGARIELRDGTEFPLDAYLAGLGGPAGAEAPDSPGSGE
jgi:hypothetical protein